MLKTGSIIATTTIGAFAFGCGGHAIEGTLAQVGDSGGAPSVYGGASAGAAPLERGKGGTSAGVSSPKPGNGAATAGNGPGEAGAPSSGVAGAPGRGGASSGGMAGSPAGCGMSDNAGSSPPGGEAGDAGFAGAPGCGGLVFVPSTPLITGAFGSVAIPHVIYEYTAPGLVPATAVALTASDGTFAGIAVSAAPGVETDPMNRWLGVGLPVAGCVDASAYRGVKFTITGDLGSCALSFGLVTSEDNSDTFAGSCHASSCYGPTSDPLQVGTSVVLFSDMKGGSPQRNVDPAALNDLQWQLTVPCDGMAQECVADFTISDVSFVGP